MSKVTWKPGTLLAPVPAVMVSCGTMEKPNIITVAWTGIVNSDPAMTYVSVRKERFSHELILKSGEFVLVRLENVFRQAEVSPIVVNAHKINRGQMPDFIEGDQGSRKDTTLTIVPSDFLISVNDCETMTTPELNTYINGSSVYLPYARVRANGDAILRSSG